MTVIDRNLTHTIPVDGPRQLTRIEPPRLLEPIGLRELWDYRFLIWMWGVRAVKGKYKQSVLGVAWAAIGPLIRVFLIAIVFGKLARFPSGGQPYALFAFVAMVPWTVFSGVYGSTASCLQTAKALVAKIYFPRLVLPLAALIALAVHTAVQLAIQFGLMAWYDVYPAWRSLLILPVLLYCVALGLGVGLVSAAMSIRYRDVSQFMGIILQVWLAGTPIAYDASLIRDHFPRLYPWYQLNPLFQATELARWCFMPWELRLGPLWYVPPILTLLLLLIGLYWFRRTEQVVADVI